MIAGEEVTVDGIRYRVESVTARWVTYRVRLGTGWSDERAIVRSAWIAMTSPTWVGPGHAAPGWCEADGKFGGGAS